MINAGQIKKEARALLNNNWNHLVLTLFIPFMFVFGVYFKIFANKTTRQIYGIMDDPKYIPIFLTASFAIMLSNLAMLKGLDNAYNKGKKSLIGNYFFAFKNIFRALPLFFIKTVLPLAASFVLSSKIPILLYDRLFLVAVDFRVYLMLLNILGVFVDFYLIYITISTLFTSCVMVIRPELSGIDVIIESFFAARKRKWRLIFLCIGFLGWYLLGFCAFIIGTLWANVYFNATIYLYYRRLWEDGRNSSDSIENQGA